MTNPPQLFSIITVTLNNLASLQKTSLSVNGQTCTDYEWIVIDGASSDGTIKWLERTNAQWISEPDQGLYDAMNKGIERAQGEYLLFLNAGDTLTDTTTLERIKTAIRNNTPPDFIYGDSYEEIKNKSPFYKTARNINKIHRGMITHHQAILYRKNAAQNLRYNTRYKLAADYDFTVRFLQNKTCTKTLYVPFPICLFESGGLSQQNAAKSRLEESTIRSNLYLGTPLSRILTPYRQWLATYIRNHVPKLYEALRKFI